MFELETDDDVTNHMNAIMDQVLQSQQAGIHDYDDLVTKWLPDLVNRNCTVDTQHPARPNERYRVSLTNAVLRRTPGIGDPMSCIRHGRTYTMDLVTDVTFYRLNDSKDEVVEVLRHEEAHVLASLPLPILSPIYT